MARYEVVHKDGKPIQDHHGNATGVHAPDEQSARDHAAYVRTLKDGRMVKPSDFTVKKVKD